MYPAAVRGGQPRPPVRSQTTMRPVSTMKKILIATDGSEGARHAARVGVDLAIALDASVRLVHAIRPDDEWVLRQRADGLGESDLFAVVSEEVFPAAMQMLEEAGIPYETRLLHDAAARAIVQDAVEWGADVIVIGHRGMSALERFLMGSTALKVTSLAPVPVLVVPHEDEPEDVPEDGPEDEPEDESVGDAEAHGDGGGPQS